MTFSGEVYISGKDISEKRRNELLSATSFPATIFLIKPKTYFAANDDSYWVFATFQNVNYNPQVLIDAIKNTLFDRKVWVQYRSDPLEACSLYGAAYENGELVYNMHSTCRKGTFTKEEDIERNNDEFNRVCEEKKDGIVDYMFNDNDFSVRVFENELARFMIDGTVLTDQRANKHTHVLFYVKKESPT